jgi:DNA polymerase alpha subunit A
MSSLLGNLDKAPAKVEASKSRKRKPVPDCSSDDDISFPASSKFKSYRKKTAYADLSSDGPIEDNLPTSDGGFSPKKRVKVDDGSVTPAVEQLADLDVHGSSDVDSSVFDDIDFNELMDIDIDELDDKPVVKEEQKPVKLKSTTTNGISTATGEEDVKPTWLSVYDSLNVESQESQEPITASSSSKSTDIAALEGDGSFRFFWLDYLELEGKVYFIGKLKDKESGTWVSCCVTVEGLQRSLFCLPRERRVEQDEDGEFYDTDIVPAPEDVHADFELIRKQLGIKSWRAKFVKRKYVFGEKDVPRSETQWLKVVYGFDGELFPFPNICLCTYAIF